MKSHDWKEIPDDSLWRYHFVCDNCGIHIISDKMPEEIDGKLCVFHKFSSDDYATVGTNISLDCEEQNIVEIMNS